MTLGNYLFKDQQLRMCDWVFYSVKLLYFNLLISYLIQTTHTEGIGHIFTWRIKIPTQYERQWMDYIGAFINSQFSDYFSSRSPNSITESMVFLPHLLRPRRMKRRLKVLDVLWDSESYDMSGIFVYSTDRNTLVWRRTMSMLQSGFWHWKLDSQIAQSTLSYCVLCHIIVHNKVKAAYFNLRRHFLHTWKFYLHSYLRLELDIHKMTTKYFHKHPCLSHMLGIFSYVGAQDNDYFRLCPINPKVSVFPQFNNVFLHLNYSADPGFHLDISVDIISPSLVVSCDLSYRWIGNAGIQANHFRIISDTKSIHHFHIVTDKHKKLFLQVKANVDYLIWIGPGKYAESSHLTTIPSFQCIVHTAQTTDNCFSNVSNVKFISLPNTDAAQHVQFNMSFKGHKLWQFPKFPNLILQMFAFTITDATLKLSFEEFSFTVAEDTFDCLLGGVSIFRSIGSQFEEFKSFCLQRSSANHVPNLCIMNSTMLVIGYFFRNYSSLRFVMNVSVSSCTAIDLNICELYACFRTKHLSCTLNHDEFLHKVVSHKPWYDVTDNNSQSLIVQLHRRGLNAHCQMRKFQMGHATAVTVRISRKVP